MGRSWCPEAEEVDVFGEWQDEEAPPFDLISGFSRPLPIDDDRLGTTRTRAVGVDDVRGEMGGRPSVIDPLGRLSCAATSWTPGDEAGPGEAASPSSFLALSLAAAKAELAEAACRRTISSIESVGFVGPCNWGGFC